jgi:hypothetical protein
MPDLPGSGAAILRAGRAVREADRRAVVAHVTVPCLDAFADGDGGDEQTCQWIEPPRSEQRLAEESDQRGRRQESWGGLIDRPLDGCSTTRCCVAAVVTADGETGGTGGSKCTTGAGAASGACNGLIRRCYPTDHSFCDADCWWYPKVY